MSIDISEIQSPAQRRLLSLHGSVTEAMLRQELIEETSRRRIDELRVNTIGLLIETAEANRLRKAEQFLDPQNVQTIRDQMGRR